MPDTQGRAAQIKTLLIENGHHKNIEAHHLRLVQLTRWLSDGNLMGVGTEGWSPVRVEVGCSDNITSNALIDDDRVELRESKLVRWCFEPSQPPGRESKLVSWCFEPSKPPGRESKLVSWCFEPCQPLGRESKVVSWCFEPSQPLGRESKVVR